MIECVRDEDGNVQTNAVFESGRTRTSIPVTLLLFFAAETRTIDDFYGELHKYAKEAAVPAPLARKAAAGAR